MTIAPGSPPPVCAVVAGPVEIWVGTGTSEALEFLGWTVNGVSIQERPFIAPVVSDEYGGSAGPPSDYQLMGVQHRISLELSKYQAGVLAKLDRFYNSIALGSGFAGVGMLMDCGGLTTRLLMRSGPAGSPTFIRNYTQTLVIDPVELSPIGAQATRARVNFIVNAKAGVIPWDTSES
jgi:hypothetical protein